MKPPSLSATPSSAPAPYERTETRRDYANGFKPKTLLTQHGELTFQVPRRRTRVASIFPNPDSCLRLVFALLAELDDEWMTSKVYLNFNL